MAESKEEETREVVDKRRVKLDKDGKVHMSPEAKSSKAKPKEKEAEDQAKPEDTAGLPPIDVYAVLRYFISVLGTYAWQWLGLVKNPVTGQVDKDLAQAKIAIDTVAALIHQLEGKVDESERRELKGLLGDLQINFVQQTTREPRGSTES